MYHWHSLLFAIFQQVSNLVASTSFLSTTEYSSKSLHLPIRPVSSKYTSHHGLCVFQPRNFFWCHTYPLTSVGEPSATALLQHVIQFLLPLKIVCSSLYSFKRHLKSHLIAQLSTWTINIFRPATWRLPAPPIHDSWPCARYKFSSSSYYYYE